MEQIETQLAELRLHGMNRAWTALLETRKHHELSLSQGLELLLQNEQQDRRNKRFDRLKKNAGFRYQASVEEVYTESERGVSKELMASLATGRYIQNGESVLITGKSGCGKSFIASALGHQACAYSVNTGHRYRTIPDTFLEKNISLNVKLIPLFFSNFFA